MDPTDDHFVYLMDSCMFLCYGSSIFFSEVKKVYDTMHLWDVGMSKPMVIGYYCVSCR